MSDTDTANRITCKYLAYRHSKTVIRLPLIHIYLEAQSDVETDALVDSGSTTTFIPYEIADAIGLLPEKQADMDKLPKTDARAASSSFPTYIISLPVLKAIKGAHAFDTFKNIVVQVPQNEKIALPYAILGRDHIFKHFDITFHENRQKITFERLNGSITTQKQHSKWDTR